MNKVYSVRILKELGLLVGMLLFINLIAFTITQTLPSETWNIATGLLTIIAIVLYTIGDNIISKEDNLISKEVGD